ncbi:hypothetical protein FOYG_11627 [Fusarium oxysporum NRRL 32931]|uniref:Uncharacterized protein n=1 Tax=Fusarium oxysporum NRRL 32931 TaxID=660029 RepID=W9HYN8_FUSOX|nr:hypothetical protein FOYG_11627 [Fusarium oxysporum NRRL 32931]
MSSRPNRKRPASGSLQAPPAKRGRPTKADRDSQVPPQAISRLTARSMLDAKASLEIDPCNERQAYHDLISQSIENWDDEDEKPVVAEWDRSDAKSSCRDFTQRSALLNTWRISLRLYQLAPVTILSYFFRLRYQPVSTNGMANEVLYSVLFSNELSKIMVHPCWEQDPDLLALGLRWTAICRLDDRRCWEIEKTNECPALGALKKAIEERGDTPLALPYHEMHQVFRQDAFEQDRVPSALSDLLCEIGRAVSDEESTPPPPAVDPEYEMYQGFPVVPVTLWDLQVLSKAISSTSFKPEWDYSTDEALKAWTAENTDKDVPTKDKLPILYELAYKDMFRHRISYEREPTPTSESESSDEDVAGPSRNCRSRNIVHDNDDDKAGTRRNTSDPNPSLDRPASRRSDGEDPGQMVSSMAMPHTTAAATTHENY